MEESVEPYSRNFSEKRRCTTQMTKTGVKSGFQMAFATRGMTSYNQPDEEGASWSPGNESPDSEQATATIQSEPSMRLAHAGGIADAPWTEDDVRIIAKLCQLLIEWNVAKGSVPRGDAVCRTVFNACVVQTIGGSMKKAVGYTRASGLRQMDMESSPDRQATLLRNAVNRTVTLSARL
jgi:hypothetical protein